MKILDHQYTKAGLSFQSLKNEDLAVAEMLKQTKKVCVFLGQVTINESGFFRLFFK